MSCYKKVNEVELGRQMGELFDLNDFTNKYLRTLEPNRIQYVLEVVVSSFDLKLNLNEVQCNLNKEKRFQFVLSLNDCIMELFGDGHDRTVSYMHLLLNPKRYRSQLLDLLLWFCQMKREYNQFREETSATLTEYELFNEKLVHDQQYTNDLIKNIENIDEEYRHVEAIREDINYNILELNKLDQEIQHKQEQICQLLQMFVDLE